MDDDEMTMGTSKHANGMNKQRGSSMAIVDEADDLMGMASSVAYSSTVRSRSSSLNESVVEEVAGEEWVPLRSGEEGTEVSAHEEVGSGENSESVGQFFEATPEQLETAAEAGVESAESDLESLEGYRPRDTSGSGENSVEVPLKEAGVAIGGEEAEPEFLPILAALVPTLISTIGPPVAKAIVSKLSPVAKKVITNFPPRPARPLPRPGAVGPLARPKLTGGISNILAQLGPMLAKLLQTQGKESGAEVDEAFVEEAAAALEVIIGIDDRLRITQTTRIPFRRICALRITFPSGVSYRGTGFIIGPRAVATAGHCVYLHNQGGWARKVEVIPGCDGSNRPYGQAESVAFRSVSGWVTGKKPESDYGCVILPPNAFGGRNLGSFGFANFDPQKLLAQKAVLAGYPGDKAFAELWGMSRTIKTVTAKTLIYDIDTMGGQSGAPVYVKREGKRYVVGIHNYGATTGNSATRITQPVYDRLVAWSKL